MPRSVKGGTLSERPVRGANWRRGSSPESSPDGRSESVRSSRLPRSCIVRQRVEAALASGLEGNERSDAELWLEGYRRLTPTMLALPALDGVEIRVRKPLRAANQRLMDYLGVSVVVDQDAPPNYSFGDVIGNRQLRLTEMAGRR